VTNLNEKCPVEGQVTLADGSTMSADLVVAADGIPSKAVKNVTGYDNPATETGMSCFRFLMRKQEILDDEKRKVWWKITTECSVSIPMAKVVFW
jgi:2-polyprenyl-6-methoxyphenol hydroxylase-like FAD-dependent oxidoreductase